MCLEDSRKDITSSKDITLSQHESFSLDSEATYNIYSKMYVDTIPNYCVHLYKVSSIETRFNQFGVDEFEGILP